MNLTDFKREARESVAHETAELARLNAVAKDRARRYAVVEKKIDKARQPAVRKRNNGDIELVDLWSLYPERAYNQPDIDVGSPKMVKAAIDELAKGERKVQVGGYSQPPASLPRLAKSYRILNAVDTRELRRLDGVIKRANIARSQLIHNAFDRGIEQTVEGLAKAAVANHQLRTEANRTQPEHYDPRESVVRRLTIAKEHLAGVRAKGFDCECQWCDQRRASERHKQEEAAKLAERLATMPKGTVKHCPCGQGHRVPIDRQREWVRIGERDELLSNVPIFYCPKTGKRYVHMGILTEEREAQAKADEKARAKAEKIEVNRTKNILAAGGVVFRCPSCSTDQPSVLDDGMDADDQPIKYVSCYDCDESWAFGDVKIVKRGRAPTLGLEKEVA